MVPFCSPANRNLEQGEKAKVLMECGNNKGVTSEQELEKMDKHESAATTQFTGEAEAQIEGLDWTGPLGSMVANVTI